MKALRYIALTSLIYASQSTFGMAIQGSVDFASTVENLLIPLGNLIAQTSTKQPLIIQDKASFTANWNTFKKTFAPIQDYLKAIAAGKEKIKKEDATQFYMGLTDFKTYRCFFYNNLETILTNMKPYASADEITALRKVFNQYNLWWTDCIDNAVKKLGAKNDVLSTKVKVHNQTYTINNSRKYASK